MNYPESATKLVDWQGDPIAVYMIQNLGSPLACTLFTSLIRNYAQEHPIVNGLQFDVVSRNDGAQFACLRLNTTSVLSVVTVRGNILDAIDRVIQR
jgi:hypothetical protein